MGGAGILSNGCVPLSEAFRPTVQRITDESPCILVSHGTAGSVRRGWGVTAGETDM
jgi:hypothetical protein